MKLSLSLFLLLCSQMLFGQDFVSNMKSKCGRDISIISGKDVYELAIGAAQSGPICVFWDTLTWNAPKNRNKMFRLINRTLSPIKVKEIKTLGGPLSFSGPTDVAISPRMNIMLRPKFSNKGKPGPFTCILLIKYQALNESKLRSFRVIHYGLDLMNTQSVKEQAWNLPPGIAEYSPGKLFYDPKPIESLFDKVPITPFKAEEYDTKPDSITCFLRYPAKLDGTRFSMEYWNESDTFQTESVRLDSITSCFHIQRNDRYRYDWKFHISTGRSGVVAKAPRNRNDNRRDIVIYLRELIEGRQPFYYNSAEKSALNDAGFYHLAVERARYGNSHYSHPDSIESFLNSKGYRYFSKSPAIIRETNNAKLKELERSLKDFYGGISLQRIIDLNYDSYHRYWGAFSSLTQGYRLSFDETVNVPKANWILGRAGIRYGHYRLLVEDNKNLVAYIDSHLIEERVLADALERLWVLKEVLSMHQVRNGQEMLD